MHNGCASESNTDLFFQVFAVISPVISSIATGYITYSLTNRSKKTEYLYQHRISAFKAIFKVVTAIRRFALGQIALELGAETSPYFDEPGSPLSLSDDLARIREENEIFLTERSREALDRLNNSLGGFASIVLAQAGIAPAERDSVDYSPLEKLAKDSQAILYEEIDLPKG
jgi:hypothetical protein